MIVLARALTAEHADDVLELLEVEGGELDFDFEDGGVDVGDVCVEDAGEGGADFEGGELGEGEGDAGGELAIVQRHGGVVRASGIVVAAQKKVERKKRKPRMQVSILLRRSIPPSSQAKVKISILLLLRRAQESPSHFVIFA